MPLTELNEQVRNKNIVICRSDKDGKLVVLNFNDYKKIIKLIQSIWTLGKILGNLDSESKRVKSIILNK